MLYGKLDPLLSYLILCLGWQANDDDVNFQFPHSSMPHGSQIILPFFIATMAFVLNFRILTTCDLVNTQWSIDCSNSDEYCVYITDVKMGFLCK